MKTLLDVTKALLLINGVVVLPSVLLFRSIYEQQLLPTAMVAQTNDSSSIFHRHLGDDSSKYEQKLQQLKTEVDSQIKELETTIKEVKSQNPSNGIIAASSDSNLANLEQLSTLELIKQTQALESSLAQTVSRGSSPKLKRESSETLPITNSGNNTQKPKPVTPPQEKITEFKESSPSTKPSESPKKQPSLYDKEIIADSETHKKDSLELNRAANNHPPKNEEFITLASLLHEGLVVADQKGQINRGTTNYQKVETAINKLANGEAQTLYHAARSSGIESEVLANVKKLGENYSETRELSREIQDGLLEAHKKGHVTHGTSNYKKVQTAVFSLRHGKSSNLEDAARRSGIESRVLEQLVIWGRNRRGASHVSYSPN